LTSSRAGAPFLGIGASWNEDEYRAYGFGDALPPIRERLDRLEEALEVCRAMFSGAESSFHGSRYRLEGALNVPRPVQPGGPPIAVRGAARMSEETFRFRCIVGDPDLVAEQAQALLDAGLDGLTFFTSGLWTPEDVGLAGQAIAQLRG
jgi:alkanesulfonate monooxygenase SsuD/methylene tetrahydromethanopterin reductase-like flavin-dependent oxidoreductase (luciferase family)